jgi:hypothetical protein
MDEALGIVRRLLAGETVSHEGEFFTLEETRMRPTPEQPVPLIVGGRSDAALCRAPARRRLAGHLDQCDPVRGHISPVQWLTECRGRGWAPDEERLTRALEALAAAIARRGGQRRARPYLDGQLRRLRRQRPAAS